jgi:hypothetical protein
MRAQFCEGIFKPAVVMTFEGSITVSYSQFAKAACRQEIRQSHRPPQPFENHNQPVLSIRK